VQSRFGASTIPARIQRSWKNYQPRHSEPAVGGRSEVRFYIACLLCDESLCSWVSAKERFLIAPRGATLLTRAAQVCGGIRPRVAVRVAGTREAKVNASEDAAVTVHRGNRSGNAQRVGRQIPPGGAFVRRAPDAGDAVDHALKEDRWIVSGVDGHAVTKRRNVGRSRKLRPRGATILRAE